MKSGIIAGITAVTLALGIGALVAQFDRPAFSSRPQGATITEGRAATGSSPGIAY